MAMQSGVGLSKIIILFGAGYTGTILLKNEELSNLLARLQTLVKGLHKTGDSANADSDPIAAQVHWLAQEVRRLASARQITVLNGRSGGIDISSLVIPVGALGVLGYGYMWWKGFSFSDFMYVTKRNMVNAVANLTKHLESVSEALARTKKHLTQRMENLDGKVDDVKEMSKLIKNEVGDVRADFSRIGCELFDLKNTVYQLDGRINIMEDKQNLTLSGVDYLCQFVDGKRVPDYQKFLQEQYRLTGKTRGQLTSAETPALQGLKDIVDIFSETKMITDGGGQDTADVLSNQPRSLLRTSSIKPAIAGF
ncbi:hypothetical protein Ancab_020670 [Ancistrocladus abbreviatus]